MEMFRTVLDSTAGEADPDIKQDVLIFFRRDSFVKGTVTAPPVLSNGFFKDLLSENWSVYHVPDSQVKLFTTLDNDTFIYKTDLMFK